MADINFQINFTVNTMVSTATKMSTFNFCVLDYQIYFTVYGPWPETYCLIFREVPLTLKALTVTKMKFLLTSSLIFQTFK